MPCVPTYQKHRKKKEEIDDEGVVRVLQPEVTSDKMCCSFAGEDEVEMGSAEEGEQPYMRHRKRS